MAEEATGAELVPKLKPVFEVFEADKEKALGAGVGFPNSEVVVLVLEPKSEVLGAAAVEPKREVEGAGVVAGLEPNREG